ncbi:MAG: M28 family peptidase, partial [Thermoanaerobaculia bacterium]|nr:M28 family peptidase [Thermoanaerobaculia bacterium]
MRSLDIGCFRTAGLAAAVLLMILCPGAPGLAQEGEALRHFYPERRESQARLEAALASVPGAQSARDHHDLLSSRPHVAGTPGDQATIRALVEAYRRIGLEVETQDLRLYLPRPVRGEVEIVAPEPMVLTTREEPLPEDPFTDHPDLEPGWLGYSGNGEVMTGVVYGNYGREEDFRRLEELGVGVEGKIVLMRYGKLFRGFKVANAEAAGAAAAILYSDPEDQGWGRGIPYPEGGWYNGQSIQRGSVATLPYPGDPLTPGEPATSEAARRSPDRVPLPEIPAQPLGWDAAREILSRMEGPSVPDEWQGGLPFRYRLEGGAGLSVRVAVEQELELRRTANVIARLPGAESPQETVIVGCHHDAWSFGASDPNSGSVVLFEVARGFAEAARRGVRPKRTLVFAHWAAEELGLQGSTEWVEAHETELRNDAVAYLNLDMAGMGTRFGAAASPSLAPLIREVAGEFYPERKDLEEAVRGTLGGGSDHVPFSSRVGVPVASTGVWGSDGSAYHTNYDTLVWYRQVVGSDYRGPLQLARLVGRVAARLANADVLPLQPLAYGEAVGEALADLRSRAEEKGMEFPEDSLRSAMELFRSEAVPTMDALWEVIAESGFTREGLVGLNWELRQMERLWLDDEGLPERPWYRNLLASPDPS